jgi:ribosomal protein S18 acetylase RimI-like enzyme
VIKNVERNYLEIYSIKELNFDENKPIDFSLNLLDPKDFQLNKFFYKSVGKNHHWVDRLIWTDQQWIEYVYNKDVQTYVLKKKDDLAGYFELILHRDKNEIEIAYLGLLEEYQNQKLGSFLLSEAIKNSFLIKVKRVWVHTCSLDHKNALKNYLSRGMKIFKKEKVSLQF